MESSLITVRLPTSLLERADALLDKLEAIGAPWLWGRASRSWVLRLAVLSGIEQLQAQVADSEQVRSSGKAPSARTRAPRRLMESRRRADDEA